MKAYEGVDVLCEWLYSPCGSWPLFQSPDLFTIGRTPWTSDQLLARPLTKHRTAQTQNKHIYTHQTSIPWVGFEPTITASEQAKTVHGRINPRFLDLDTSWRWVVSFTPRPLYRRYPLDRRLSGPQNAVEKRKSLALLRLELRPLFLPVGSQSLYREHVKYLFTTDETKVRIFINYGAYGKTSFCK
jgi:hypothetical protein